MNVEALKTERDRLREWIRERASDLSISSAELREALKVLHAGNRAIQNH